MANLYDKPVNLDFINTYVSPDFNMLMKSGAMMQQTADQAQLSRDEQEQKMLNVNALTFGKNKVKDDERRDQIIDDYTASFEKKLEEVGGSYYKMAPFIKEQRQKLQRDLTRGELGRIQSNYDTYAKWYEDTNARVLAQDVNSNEFKIAQNKIRSEYGGAGTPEDLQSIQIMELVDQNNYQELALEIAGQIKGSSYTSVGDWIAGTGVDKGDLPTYILNQRTVDVENLKASEIDMIVKAALKSNPVYADHLNQRKELLLWNHEKQLSTAGSDLLREKGGLDEEDEKAMRSIETLDENGNKRNLDPNNFDDIETYARMLKGEEFKYKLIDDAAAVAAETYNYQKVKESTKQVTDQTRLKGVTDKIDAQNAAFVSELGGTKTDVSMSDVSANIQEANSIIDNSTESISEVTSQFGLDELLSPQGSRQFDGMAQGATPENLSEMFSTQEGFDYIVEHIMSVGENGMSVSRQRAIDIAGDLQRKVSGVNILKTKVQAQQEVLGAAKNKFINNISDNKWASLYGEYSSSAGESEDKLSKGQFEDIIAISTTIEELRANYKRMTGYTTPERGTPMPGSIWGGYEASASDRFLGPNTEDYKTLEKMWEDVDNQIPSQIATVDFHRKLDYANIKGDVSGRWEEIITANEALNNPSTKIKIGTGNGLTGQGSTMTIGQYLTEVVGEDIDWSKMKVKGKWVTTTGRPTYEIYPTYKDKIIPTFKADIPLRGGTVREAARDLISGNNSETDRAMKAHIAITAIDNYDPIVLAALGDNDTMPLSVGGNNNFRIKASDGLYRVEALDPRTNKYRAISQNGVRHTNQVDALADLYDFLPK
jgi:hypothetical protein